MFITPAYAQAAGGAGGPDLIASLLPFILIFVIMYFLIIRPQRKSMKERAAMLEAVRRNDTVVTGGGIVGKVTKVIDDSELEVEIAQGTKIRVLRSMLADVRVKGEPVAANDSPPAKKTTPAAKKTTPAAKTTPATKKTPAAKKPAPKK